MRDDHALSTPSPPPGFEWMNVGRAQILARTEALPWSRQAVSAYGSLHQAALASSESTLQGRGPVVLLANPDGVGPAWVVRRYYRGGLMRPMGDRFLRRGTPRSFSELDNTARIEALGFATPRVLAAAAYPGGLLYRADLVTELVPHARTLADVLFGPSGSSGGRADRSARREAMACVAELITRLARAGVHHPDFNAHNLLIAREAQRVHAILVDLDRCRVAGQGGRAAAARLRRRLVRSIRKLERASAEFHSDGEGHLSSDEIDELLVERKAS